MSKRKVLPTPPNRGRGRSSSTRSGPSSYSKLGSPSPKECDPDPTEVVIISDCEAPVYVELCPNSLGIETAMSQLGCVVDDDGYQIGVVMVCKITDEATGENIFVPKAFFEDGTTIDNYDGEWSVCAQDACVPEEPLGVITDLSLLAI